MPTPLSVWGKVFTPKPWGTIDGMPETDTGNPLLNRSSHNLGHTTGHKSTKKNIESRHTIGLRHIEEVVVLGKMQETGTVYFPSFDLTDIRRVTIE